MSRVVLLSGPAGSGKSSAAAAWAARGPGPRAVIDADALRLLIRAGAAYPEDGWTGETERQWNIAMELWMAMARVYKTHDVDCIVDVYAPPIVDDPWRDLVNELGIERAILLPRLAVCQERNRVRNRQPFLGAADLEQNYADFEWCVRAAQPKNVIDNSQLSVEQTVDAIEAQLRERG